MDEVLYGMHRSRKDTETDRQTDIHTEAERGHEKTSDYRRTT